MEQSNGLRKSILLGLTASATVPLFLKTVSSTLMEDALKGSDVSYFVFFGFCTVAALFSSKFLQSLADKLLQDLKEMKQKQAELSETTDVLVAQNSDPADLTTDDNSKESDSLGALESFSRNTEAAPTLSNSQRVLLALRSSKFAFRTLQGVANDSGLTPIEAQELLNELKAQGKVLSTRRARDGTTVWSLK